MDDASRDRTTTPADTPGGRRSLAVAAITIGIGILVELALLALIPIFVTTDGAAHIDGAAALARLAFGPPSPVDGYTTISWLPATNLIPELPMAALAALVGAALAETLVIAAWIILLPASLWYAVSGVRPGAGWLAVLALPLTFGLMLQLGFYSFIYGVLLFLVVVGYHARHREHLGGGQVGALAVLLTLTYAAHAFVFGVTVLVLAILEGWAWLVQPPRTAGGLGRRAGMVLLAALPAVVLVIAGVLFGPRSSSAAAAGDGAGLIAFQVRALLESLTLILQLVVFDQKEAVFALLVAGLLAGLAIVALRSRLRGHEPRLTPADGYLAVVAVLLVAILFVPDATTLGAGGAGAFLTSRLLDIRHARRDPLDRGPPVRVVGAGRHDRRRGRGGDRPGRHAVHVVPGAQRPRHRIRLGREVRRRGRDHGPGQPVADRAAVVADRPDRERDGRLTAITRGLDLGDAELGDHVHVVRYPPGRSTRTATSASAGGLPSANEPVIDPEGVHTGDRRRARLHPAVRAPERRPGDPRLDGLAAARRGSGAGLSPGGGRGWRAARGLRASRDRGGRSGRRAARRNAVVRRSGGLRERLAQLTPTAAQQGTRRDLGSAEPRRRPRPSWTMSSASGMVGQARARSARSRDACSA